MSSFQQAKRTRILARIAVWESQLTSAYTTLDNLLQNDVEEYRFDSTEGSQRVRNRSISQLERVIEKLERLIEYWYRRLNNQGLVSIALRRHY